MNDNSSSTYIIVTVKWYHIVRHGPRFWKDMKARLMGLPSILRAVNSLFHAARMRLCSLTTLLSGKSVWLRVQRTEIRSGCVGDAGRADSIWDLVMVAGVKEKCMDAKEVGLKSFLRVSDSSIICYLPSGSPGAITLLACPAACLLSLEFFLCSWSRSCAWKPGVSLTSLPLW